MMPRPARRGSACTHTLDTWMNPKSKHPSPTSCLPNAHPVGTMDVFVDDFIQLGQGRPLQLRTLRCHLLHSVDAVLSRPGPMDKRNEAGSLKKLLSGDGSWGTHKLILSWIIDSAQETIKLPPQPPETGPALHLLQAARTEADQCQEVVLHPRQAPIRLHSHHHGISRPCFKWPKTKPLTTECASPRSCAPT
jgi:hypothetical protein